MSVLDELDYSDILGEEPQQQQPENQNIGPGMDIGTSFPQKNTLPELGRGVNAMAQGGLEGVKQLGEGAKQTALQVGEATGLAQSGASQSYTDQTNTAQAARSQRLREKFPDREFEVGTGEFIGKNLPFLTPMGGPAGAGIKMAKAGGIGALLGGTQFSEDDSVLGKAVTAAAPAGLASLGLGAKAYAASKLRKSSKITKDLIAKGIKPTLGQMSQSYAGDRTDKFFASVFGGGTQSQLNKQAEKVSGMTNKLLNNKAESITRLAKQGINKDVAGMMRANPTATAKSVVDDLYNAGNRQLPDVPKGIELVSFKEAAGNFAKKFTEFGSKVRPAGDTALASRMQQLAAMKPLNGKQAEGFRQLLNRTVKEFSQVPGGPRAVNQLIKAYDADVLSFAKATGSAAEKTLQMARKAFGDKQQLDLITKSFDAAMDGVVGSSKFNTTKFAKSLDKLLTGKSAPKFDEATTAAMKGYAQMIKYLGPGLQLANSGNTFNRAITAAGIAGGSALMGYGYLAPVLYGVSWAYKFAPGVLRAASKLKNPADMGVLWAKIISLKTEQEGNQ